MIVVACEGNSEVKLMSLLLEEQRLIFSSRDILDHRPFHIRQPKAIATVLNDLPLREEITFYRIGDTLNDKFDLNCFGELRKEHIKVVNVCTTPEIEMLIIICEGLFNDYSKNKNEYSPKEYVKTFVKGYVSFDDYIKNHDMIFAIKEYKRLKKQRRKDDLFLADLLR